MVEEQIGGGSALSRSMLSHGPRQDRPLLNADAIDGCRVNGMRASLHVRDSRGIDRAAALHSLRNAQWFPVGSDRPRRMKPRGAGRGVSW